MDVRVERAVLDVMNAGLVDLEPHPLLHQPATVGVLHRFEAHSLVYARALGRLLERRVARNLDRDEPRLAPFARVQLRIHQPFPKALETELVRLGHPRSELENLAPGPRTQALLDRAERAVGARDVPLAHVLLMSGLECLTQLLARRGAELVDALGGTAQHFEARHLGHEGLLFMGLRRLGELPEAEVQSIPEALAGFFEDATAAFDEWMEGPPPERRRSRTRRRTLRWGTADLPTDVA